MLFTFLQAQLKIGFFKNCKLWVMLENMMNDFCFFKYYGDDESGLELFCFKSSLEKKKKKGHDGLEGRCRTVDLFAQCAFVDLYCAKEVCVGLH